MEMVKRIVAVVGATAATYLIGTALFFLNYNWTVFVQFVKDVDAEGMITLIIPALIAGGVGHALWSLGKKKS